LKLHYIARDPMDDSDSEFDEDEEDDEEEEDEDKPPKGEEKTVILCSLYPQTVRRSLGPTYLRS
jgi:hypothetical protein